jgi:hypothetical protein
MEEARRHAQASIQNLLGYLKQHGEQSSPPPPEHVIVYDEAQRAWDEKTGKRLLGRLRSEPALFLDIMARLPWACLVCVVGPGQEINRGEGGLALWGDALREAVDSGLSWDVHASPVALAGGDGLVGSGLFENNSDTIMRITPEPLLHLSAGIRSYRNQDHSQWVEAVLESDLERARVIAGGMPQPPAFLTRDLNRMRDWLHARGRGGRRIGLLASSGAVRLVADGIPPSPRSTNLSPVGHWFLRDLPDYRSSNSLETPLSEFVCQGLEIDYAGLCWGGDLIWNESMWVARSMKAPKWTQIRKNETVAYRFNAYRVLLTRAREGLAIYVPQGDKSDPSRDPDEFDQVYQSLLRVGCAVIPGYQLDQ